MSHVSPSSTPFQNAEFARLTTFRRSGEPVPTPMWFAIDGGRLVFSTPAGVGKLKRLRHTTRVEVQPCSRRGEPEPGSTSTAGTARIVTEAAERESIEAQLQRKYGWQWWLLTRAERVVKRVRHRSAPEPRVALMVTLDDRG